MWSIVVTEDFMRKLRKMGIYKRVISYLAGLAEMLEKEPSRVLEVLRYNPVIFSIGEYSVRRCRVGKYRLFYIIMDDKKLIVFFDVKPRRKAYRR